MFRNFFKKKSVGLDIGDAFIRYVELGGDKDNLRVIRFGEAEIPSGLVKEGEVKSPDKLNDFFQNFIKKHKIKSVHMPISLKHKAESIARAVLKKGDNEIHIILNFESWKILFLVAARENIFYMTMLDARKSDLSEIGDEIMKHFIAWHTRKKELGERKLIEKVILCGDAEDLAKYPGYISSILKTKTELANVWQNIFSINEKIPEMTLEESLKFAAALGLALKEFE